MRRFAAAGHDDAGSDARSSGLRLDRRRQMHGKRYGANHAVRVVDQANELPECRLADQVNDAVEPRMPVRQLAALDEGDAAAEMVDDRLIARRIPPFRREVVFASGDDDPESIGDAQIRGQWLRLLGLG